MSTRPLVEQIVALAKLSCLMAKGAMMMLLLISPSLAEDIFISGVQPLGLIQGVELVVTDEVTDGCWTSVSLAKQKIRLILEQSQIPVYGESLVNNPFFPILHFSSIGFKVGGVCFGEASFIISYESFRSWETQNSLNNYIVWTISGVWRKSHIFGNSVRLNEQIVDFAEEAAAEFSANAISARRDRSVQIMLADWGELRPVTMREFQETFSSSNSTAAE